MLGADAASTRGAPYRRIRAHQRAPVHTPARSTRQPSGETACVKHQPEPDTTFDEPAAESGSPRIKSPACGRRLAAPSSAGPVLAHPSQLPGQSYRGGPARYALTTSIVAAHDARAVSAAIVAGWVHRVLRAPPRSTWSRQPTFRALVRGDAATRPLPSGQTARCGRPSASRSSALNDAARDRQLGARWVRA
jgi:hypothetical protein